MTKNRFLSKRLACLLTTALVSANSLLLSTTNANAVAIAAAGTETVTGSPVELGGTLDYEFALTGTGTLTVAPAAATILSGTITTLLTTGKTIAINDAVASGARLAATFNNQIGTSALPIATMTIGAAAATGGSGIFNSNVFVNAITVAGGGTNEASRAEFKGDVKGTIVTTLGTGSAANATLVYSGTAAQTQTGAITVTAGNGTTGVISITNPVLTQFADAVGATGARVLSTTVAADAKATFAGVHSQTLTVNGSSFLGAASNTTPIVVLGENSNLYTGRAISNGLTALGGVTTLTAAEIPATSKIHLSPKLSDGQSIKLIVGTDGVADTTAIRDAVNLALQNNALFTYTASANDTDNSTDVAVTARSASAVATQLGTNLNKSTAFIQALAASISNEENDSRGLEFFEDTMQTVGFANTSTAASDTLFANQVAPQTDTIAGSTVAAKAVTSGVQNIISTRLASLRSGDGYSTGVVTGSGMSANSGFIQGFGSTVEQKNKGNEFGYDADTTGFALGFDGKVSDGVVVGISYANSKTDVDGKGTGKAKNDIKTNSGSIYADYTTKAGYVEGSITYGKSDNKGSRQLTINDLGLRTYSSNYDSEQYSFRLFGGIPQSIGTGAFFTPFAGATISQIKTDAYTETSTTANDSFRLRVAQDTVDSQVGTIGIKYHQAIKDGKTTFTPEVKLALNQEFGDDTITSTNTYQGGGASFKNSTALEKTSATAGVGLNISADNVSFNIGYEADVRDKYLGHSAQAKLTAKF
jgi:uncharacterized protein with beta-barrel porin domain